MKKDKGWRCTCGTFNFLWRTQCRQCAKKQKRTGHDSHVMHDNSLKGHSENISAATYSERHQMILRWLREHDRRHWTDRQIMKGLGFVDMNAVRPRITELVQRGILLEYGSVVDNTTGKTCRTVGLKT